jgi:hypothetical protein
LAFAFLPTSSHALGLIQPGVRVGLYEDDFYLGVDVLTEIAMLKANPNFEWVFIDGGDFYTLNLDAMINIFPFPAAHPYAGAGLAFLFAKPEGLESSNDLGLNLIAGASFTAPMKPFVHVKYIIAEDDDTFVIGGGIRF